MNGCTPQVGFKTGLRSVWNGAKYLAKDKRDRKLQKINRKRRKRLKNREMHLLVGCRTGLRSVWKRTNLIVYQDMTMSIAWVSQHWAGVWPQMFTTGNGVLSGYCTESYHDIKFKICEMFHKSHFSLIKCSKISSTPYSIHLPYIFLIIILSSPMIQKW